MRIQLLTFDGCPHQEQARILLERALASKGRRDCQIETTIVDETSVDALKFPGSPTIRVDGKDVEPGFNDPGVYALACRVYPTRKGPLGYPSSEWIERAIDESDARN
jgi:hypothetical protein